MGVGGILIQTGVEGGVVRGFLVVREDIGEEVGAVIDELRPLGEGVDRSP